VLLLFLLFKNDGRSPRKTFDFGTFDNNYLEHINSKVISYVEVRHDVVGCTPSCGVHND